MANSVSPRTWWNGLPAGLPQGIKDRQLTKNHMLKQKPLSTVQRIRLFYLQRDVDASGVSGTGIVAEGVEFSNGTCVMTWVVGPHHCVNVYDNIKSIEAIHGHDGQTQIIFVHTDKRAA